MSTFAEELNTIRKKRHITQESLAEQLNVSRTTISRWETGAMAPDIDTVKRLSQLLDYNFFDNNAQASDTEETSDFVSEATPVAEEVAPSEPLSSPANTPAPETEPPQAQRKRRILPVAIGAVLLCIVLGICIVVFSQGNDNNNDNVPSVTAHSVVAITPSQDPTYAIHLDDFPDGVGWFYSFTIEETTDIPFTIHELNVILITDEGVEFPSTFTGQQCIDFFGSDTLTKNAPQTWTGGFPLQDLSGVRLTVRGVDANGNELTFENSLTLSKEIAE